MLKIMGLLPCLVLLAQTPETVPADGATIKRAIVGNTVEGDMNVSGRYTEFYAKDGKIHGKAYVGRRTIEGDRMCFSYGEEPASCCQVAIDGANVAWLKDGRTDGTGTIIPGNPHHY